MANIIVVSFKEETKAIKALHRIKELAVYGDITLYEHIMIRKKDKNQFQVLNDQRDGEGWRTLTGMTLGGVVGAFAGPVGFVVGLLTGSVAGVIWDVNHFDFESDFINKVTAKMNIGTITIIAEVNEDSSVFIDDALKPFSSEIIRSEADLEYDDYMDEQVEDLEEAIEEQREKLKKATADEKAKINAKITELKVKRKAKIAELEAKRKAALKDIKDKANDRIKKLETRLNGYEHAVTNSFAKARRNRLEKRIKREEEKLYQLHNALGEDIVD